ncbi:MAG: DUF6538 domain-containing protein [Alphaproteobacteria bacterium]
MADRRYLKKRGRRWYFQLAVPRALQEKAGKKVLLEALGTEDVSAAQQLRWRHLAAAQQRFEELGHNAGGLNESAIEREAQATMKRLLREAQTAARRGEALQWTGLDLRPAAAGKWDEQAGLDHAAAAYGDSLAVDDYSLVAVEAGAIINSLGGEIAVGSVAYEQLCRSQLAANLEAVRARQAALQGQTYVAPARLITPSSRRRQEPPGRARDAKTRGPNSGSGLTISQAAERCLAENQKRRHGRWTNQTRRQYETTYRLLAEFLADVPITEVARADALRFVDKLAGLDPNWGRRPGGRGASIWQLLDDYCAPPGLSAKTLNRYVASCSALFRWARQQGLGGDTNPFAELYRPPGNRTRRGYQAFTIDELNRLFNAPLFTALPWRLRVEPPQHSVQTALAWASLIALYSGLRSNEICQLRLDDIRLDGATWVFAVGSKRRSVGRRGAGRTRLVPIHTMLVQCGLPDYLAATQDHSSGLLFPALRPGGPDGKRNWYFTTAFRLFRLEERLVRRGGQGRLGFESFRANVRGALARANVGEHLAVRLLGHDRSDEERSLYRLDVDLRAVGQAVEAIQYPGLRLDHLAVGQ